MTAWVTSDYLTGLAQHRGPVSGGTADARSLETSCCFSGATVERDLAGGYVTAPVGLETLEQWSLPR